MTPRKILVTGRSGRIGKAVVRHGQASDVEIVTIGRSDAQCDLSDPVSISSFLAQHKIDAVIHCAGGEHEQLRAGSVAVPNHIQAMVEASTLVGSGVDVVFLGSAAEYGVPEANTPVGEAAVARPVSDYGRIKLASTLAITEVGQPNLTVARLFNLVGGADPMSTQPSDELARKVKEASPGEAVGVGAPEMIRDFVTISDVAAALILLAQSQEDLPSILNLGSGIGVSLGELASEMMLIQGLPARIEDLGFSVAVPSIIADVSLIESVIPWSGRRSLHHLAEAALTT